MFITLYAHLDNFGPPRGQIRVRTKITPKRKPPDAAVPRATPARR